MLKAKDMKFLKDFKEFAIKGSMMDMAIGIIIGASFNKVIDVLVKKILLPPLSLLTEGVNFQDKLIILRAAETDVDGNIISDQVAIGYGEFIGTSLDFLIIGLTVFIAVKFLNNLKKKAEDPNDNTVTTPKDIELLSNLTQLMEEQNQLLRQKQKDS
ncbi:Large-conductance mechanosensitive channel [Mariniflexile rhizosphaerae]|nr:Large-conductance mechanosensitive channel [Mariniflexile sp. TRM1-10]